MSPIMLSHCLQSGATDWSQFLVMTFFFCSKNNLNQILVTFVHSSFHMSQVQDKTSLGDFVSQNLAQHDMDMFPERLNLASAPKHVCVVRIHIVAQSPAGLLSVHLFASNLGRYKETNYFFPSEFSPSMRLCSCLVYCPHILPHGVRDLFTQLFFPFSFDI